MTELWNLFFSFAKVGMFGFGGGPAMIPLIEAEVVGVRGWLTQEEFIDVFAFGSSLPGPIATKMITYTGYKVAGIPGVISGIIGLVLPSTVLILTLGTLYWRYRDAAFVSAFFKGVRPVVVALLFLVVYQFAPKAFGVPLEWLKNWGLWLIALGAFVISIRFNTHPALLIVIGGALGILFYR